tara:strand:+ start:437 stop:553 length:117 start_codon:yes stop_codon:yes gene_type:complete
MDRYDNLMEWDKNELAEYILELEEINREIKEELTAWKR